MGQDKFKFQTGNAIAGGLGLLSTAIQSFQPDPAVEAARQQQFNASSFDELNALGSAYQSPSFQRDSLLGSFASGAMSGASSGASIGGGIGAGIGGTISGLLGVFGAAKRNKERVAKEQALGQQNASAFASNANEIQANQLAEAQANYAAFGGGLSTNGGNFRTGLSTFDAGGTHEMNPNGGIQQGIGKNGKPNMVEEGETKFNNFVFSNRVKVDEDFIKAYNLPKGIKNKTYADASKYLAKESDERPNNIISKRGLATNLARLAQSLESQKGYQDYKEEQFVKKGITELANEIAKGGSIHIKPSKVGSFTAAATKRGMGVQEFASKVLANKENYSTPMIKKANFARNAANWHAFGGSFLEDNSFMNPSTINQDDTVNYFYRGGDYMESVGMFAPAVFNLANALTKQTPSTILLPRVPQQAKLREELPYKPVDFNYKLAQLRQSIAGSNQAIADVSGGNSAIASALLRAQATNQLEKEGELALSIDNYNRAQRIKNIQMSNEARQANNAAELQRMSYNQNASLKEQEYNLQSIAAANAAKSTYGLGLADNISDISKYIQNLSSLNKMYGKTPEERDEKG